MLPSRDTYVFDIAHARQGMAINRLCASLRSPANRAVFIADESAYADRFGLTAAQKTAVLDRDWTAMLELGGSIFYTFKLAQLDNRSMQYLGGVFSGMTEEEFTVLMRSGGRDLAEIIWGLATSHVPSIGAAMDFARTGDEYWKPLFDGYAPARTWMAEHRPDVAVIVYNDHANAIDLDLSPTFAIGTGAEYPVADEGWGPRKVPAVVGDPAFSEHLVRSLVDDQFDITVLHRLEVDHGLTVPLSVYCPEPGEAWPCRVVPLLVNVIQYPQPTAARCLALGAALGRAIRSYPEDIKVAVFGTGGMSHQLAGARAGLINERFDRMFLEKIETDPQALAEISREEYVEQAGSEGIELIMWLVMRGALGERLTRIHDTYHVPASNTAAALALFEALMSSFVLLHGAWHGGWCWGRVARRLRAYGHDVYLPTFTGVSDRAHLLHPGVGLSTHVEDVVRLLEAEDLRDVVLVGHSYAGMVVSGVSEQAPERLAHRVHLDAFVPSDGEAAVDLLPEEIAHHYHESVAGPGFGWLIPPRSLTVLGVTDQTDLEWLTPRLTPHPWLSYTERLALSEAEATVPATFVECTDWMRVFRPQAERARQRGWPVMTVATGHEAMVTAPAELAELLHKISLSIPPWQGMRKEGTA